MKAQALDNHVGKTLRLRDDGTVPPDNPFVGKAGREAGDLHLRPPQRLRPGDPSRDRRAVAGRDRADGRRRGQHPHRRATTTAGRSSRRAATTRARSCPISRGRGRAWTTRGSTGCRRSARRASCSTRATSSRSWKNNLFVGALTTRQLQRIAFGQPSQAERREAAAPAAEHPHPRRPAEPRRLHLRRHRTGERRHRRRRDGAADRAYRRSRCTVKRTGTCDSARLSVINVKLMTFPSTVPR